MNPSPPSRLEKPEIAFWVFAAFAAFTIFGQTFFALGSKSTGGERGQLVQANAAAPGGHTMHAGCKMNGGGGCGCGGQR